MSPTDPIKGRTPASSHRRPKAQDVYCVPWSEWWITVSGPRRCTVREREVVFVQKHLGVGACSDFTAMASWG